MWDNLAIFKEKGLFVAREIYIFAEHLHIFLGHEDVSAPLLGFHRPHNFWIGSFRFDRDTRCQLIIVCAKKKKPPQETQQRWLLFKTLTPTTPAFPRFINPQHVGTKFNLF